MHIALCENLKTFLSQYFDDFKGSEILQNYCSEAIERIKNDFLKLNSFSRKIYITEFFHFSLLSCACAQ